MAEKWKSDTSRWLWGGVVVWRIGNENKKLFISFLFCASLGLPYLCIRQTCAREIGSKLPFLSLALPLHKANLRSGNWEQASFPLACVAFA